MSKPPGRRVFLNDVTLRDGEQAPRVAFTDDDKVNVANVLQWLGVDQLQIGFAADGVRIAERLRAGGVTLPLEALCVGFAPDWREQIERVVAAGIDGVNVLLRTSDAHLELLGLTRAEVVERAANAIGCARHAGARTVVFGPSFCFQADRTFLLELIAEAQLSGADRVTLADTVGSAAPSALAELVSEVRARIPIEVGVHCHDDLGLATACSLAGIEAGASWVDTSSGGLGERAGNAALEEVVVSATQLLGVDLGLHLSRLREAVHTVAAAAGVQVPPAKPVVGDDAFAQKLDLHVKNALLRPELFEPYDPALVGGARVIRLGKGSGPAAVQAKAAEYDLPTLTTDELDLAVEWVSRQSERTKSCVADSQFVGYLEELRAGE